MRGARAAAERRATISIEEGIARLRGLDPNTLRACWRSLTGQEAPGHLPRHLLLAMLAYRIQADAMGDLDADTAKFLKRVGSTGSGAEVVSLTGGLDQRRQGPPLGTVLSREWDGRTHRVMVVEEGFAWEGHTYDSLSKIAHTITGTRWNGPRFFGLRDARGPEP